MNLDEYNALNFNLKQKCNLAVAKTHKIDNSGKITYVTILVGGLDKENPKNYMDLVVSEFVGNRMYNEYVDANLDNPWLRIIVEDINDLLD